MFPILKQIKTLQQASLGANRLEKIFKIIEDESTVEGFSAVSVVEHWANLKDCRLNKKPK